MCPGSRRELYWALKAGVGLVGRGQWCQEVGELHIEGVVGEGGMNDTYREQADVIEQQSLYPVGSEIRGVHLDS